MLLVDDSAFPRDRAIEEVAAVELDARLGRVDLERAAGLRLAHPGRGRQIPILTDNDVVEVVPIRIAAGFGDVLSDRLERPEVEWRARGRGDLAGRDQRVIRRGD